MGNKNIRQRLYERAKGFGPEDFNVFYRTVSVGISGELSLKELKHSRLSP
jgi:hypothetical protein